VAAAAGVVAVIVVVLVGMHYGLVPGGVSSSGDAGGQTAGAKPDFPTVLPSGKTIEQLGGWGRVSPPNRNPVYAYSDNIDGVKIAVSQQPLPENFKADPAGRVKQLAQSFSATDKVMAGDTTAYVGTSLDGPQSVILQKSGLLILMKSVAKLTDKQWSDYISSLGS
jgi:hypothetical protein